MEQKVKIAGAVFQMPTDTLFRIENPDKVGELPRVLPDDRKVTDEYIIGPVSRVKPMTRLRRITTGK